MKGHRIGLSNKTAKEKLGHDMNFMINRNIRKGVGASLRFGVHSSCREFLARESIRLIEYCMADNFKWLFGLRK